MSPSSELTITIDGPAGSGKSTTAREVARRLGIRHLNSGFLYRGVTHTLLEAGIPEEDWVGLSEEDIADLGLQVRPEAEDFSLVLSERVLGPELVREAVTGKVSRVSALPAVRSWLLHIQRSARDYGSLVTDGRDMGSTVFPDADLKVYLVAAPEERARRRLAQRGIEDPTESNLEEEAKALQQRDQTDSEREYSPLRQPDGAVLIDTTELTFEEQVTEILKRANDLTLKG